MDFSSWIRRSLSRSKTQTKFSDPPRKSNQTLERKQEEEEEEALGVTEQLVDYVKSFTIDNFKNYPLQDNEGHTTTYEEENARGSSANMRKDLSEWQERHAVVVLSKVKELSQLRFMLCPRHLKEQQFWRIYFKLVKNHVAEYELRAIQVAKLKRMMLENEKVPDTCAYEVEMSETRQAASLGPTP